MTALATINPFYAARQQQATSQQQDRESHPPAQAQPRSEAVYAKLPQAPITGSPVPHLTSLYHFSRAGEYGDRSYPGNCGGNLIKDLLLYFRPASVFDPFHGSGTATDVCKDLGIPCTHLDIRFGQDACSASSYPQAGKYDFVWSHPPYWRQKIYTNDPRDLSQQPTLAAFLERYRRFIECCAGILAQGGKFAILMGDYSDREAGFVPLVYWTKHLVGRQG